MMLSATPPESGDPAGRTTRLMSVALVLFGLGVGFCVAEIGLRVIPRRRPDEYQPRIHAAMFWDENGVRRFPANGSGYHKGFGRPPVWVRINSLGFRGPELRNSPGKRIVFIGDSVVFDGGVELEDTFHQKVEQRLREEGLDVEIVNAGTSDVGIQQYERQIDTGRFDDLHADAIVIGLYLNDTRPPQGFATEKRDPLLRVFDLPVVGNSAVVRLLRQRYVAIRAEHGEIGERFAWVDAFGSKEWKSDPARMRELVRLARFDWGAAWEPSYADTVGAALLRMQHRCEGMGGRLALALFPASPQVEASFSDPYLDEPQGWTAKFAAEHGIPVIDLLPALRARSGDGLFADQCHLNVGGNAVAADTLIGFVRALATAPPSGATVRSGSPPGVDAPSGGDRKPDSLAAPLAAGRAG